jgi:hypothetical protein
MALSIFARFAKKLRRRVEVITILDRTAPIEPGPGATGTVSSRFLTGPPSAPFRRSFSTSKTPAALDHWMCSREYQIPSGKHTKNYGRSSFLMGKSMAILGKSPISMAMFHSVHPPGPAVRQWTSQEMAKPVWLICCLDLPPLTLW